MYRRMSRDRVLTYRRFNNMDSDNKSKPCRNLRNEYFDDPDAKKGVNQMQIKFKGDGSPILRSIIGTSNDYQHVEKRRKSVARIKV